MSSSGGDWRRAELEAEATGGVRFQSANQDHTNRPIFGERTLPRPRPGLGRDGAEEVVVTVAHGIVVRVLGWKLNLPPGAPGIRSTRTTCVSHDAEAITTGSSGPPAPAGYNRRSR